MQIMQLSDAQYICAVRSIKYILSVIHCIEVPVEFGMDEWEKDLETDLEQSHKAAFLGKVSGV